MSKAELVLLHKKSAGKAQSIIEGKILIPEGDLKKVLKTDVTSFVTGCEVLDKAAVITGKTKFCVVYLSEVGEFKTAELVADFNEKITDGSLIAGQNAICRAEVIDSDISGISEGEIKIAAVTDIFLTVLAKSSASYVHECDDGIVCIKKSQKYTCISAYEKTTLASEFEIETKCKIEKILNSRFAVNIKKVSAGDGSAKIEGDIEAGICFVTMQGEEQVLKTVCETVPFIEEVNAASLTFDGIFEAHAAILGSKCEFKDTEVICGINMEAAILQTAEREISSICDAFSVTNELNLTYENTSASYLAASEAVQEKISATAQVNLQNTTLNKVIGSSVKNLTITNVFVHDDFVTAEGLANVTAFTEVSSDDADDKSISSADVEIPFSIKTYIGGVKTGEYAEVHAVLSDIAVRHKRTNEIDVSCILKLNIYVYKTDSVVLVKDMILGEAKMPPSATMSFYTTRTGDTPFSISKKFSLPISVISHFNADLARMLEEENELPAGTPIVIYRRKTI